MTIHNPESTNTTTVEPKVKWAGIGAYLAGVVSLGLVAAFTQDNNALLIEVMPDALEAFLLPMVPAAVAAISGYFAKHQWRKGELGTVAPGAS